MIDRHLVELVDGIPEIARDYAAEPAEIDPEHRDPTRIAALIEIVTPPLRSADEDYYRFQAARLLCSWGYDLGFERLCEYIYDDELMHNEFAMPHRLRGYSQSYEFSLRSLVCYDATLSDAGNRDVSRKKIQKPIEYILEKAQTEMFEVRELEGLVEGVDYKSFHKPEYDEYYQPLRDYLSAIIDHPHTHHWKIFDGLKMVGRFDPDFVKSLLKTRRKKISDYELTRR
jgi:hypothetical protein